MNIMRFFVFAFLLLFPVFTMAALPAGFSFEKNLRLGSRGDDVLMLQQILNKDPRTRLAEIGPGSPGNETRYFGPITSDAAVRFQEIYAREVLMPVGLSRGTGFVGPSTRAKLNTLLAESREETQETATTDAERTWAAVIQQWLLPQNATDEIEKTAKLPQPLYERPVVKSLSRYAAPAGENITLSGDGFMRTGNRVLFDGEHSIVATSRDGATLSFKVPTLTPGVYAIAVQNTHGVSNETLLAITHTDRAAPRITRITPTSGAYGTEVTVHGAGFSRTDNVVKASYGAIRDIASIGGKTLTFRMRPTETLEEINATGAPLGYSMPVWIYIMNENGTTETPAKFLLEL